MRDDSELFGACYGLVCAVGPYYGVPRLLGLVGKIGEGGSPRPTPTPPLSVPNGAQDNGVEEGSFEPCEQLLAPRDALTHIELRSNFPVAPNNMDPIKGL